MAFWKLTLIPVQMIGCLYTYSLNFIDIIFEFIGNSRNCTRNSLLLKNKINKNICQ